MANKPIDTLRDGRLKATIWKNPGESRSFYSVNLTRTYQDGAGNYQDSDSFSNSELLRIARLAGQAYDRVNELRAADREAPEAEAPNDGRRT